MDNWDPDKFLEYVHYEKCFLNTFKQSWDDFKQECDPDVFMEALCFVVCNNITKPHLVQKELKIGFVATLRMFDVMIRAGIMSEKDSNQKRTLYMDTKGLSRIEKMFHVLSAYKQ